MAEQFEPVSKCYLSNLPQTNTTGLGRNVKSPYLEKQFTDACEKGLQRSFQRVMSKFQTT
jgi:hypothetical protein